MKYRIPCVKMQSREANYIFNVISKIQSGLTIYHKHVLQLYDRNSVSEVLGADTFT